MSLRDDLIKHQIFLQRLSVTQANEIKRYLNLMLEAAKVEIASGQYGEALKAKLRSVVTRLPDAIVRSLAEIAAYESEFSAKTFKKYTKKELQPLSFDDANKLLTTNNMPVNQREGKQAVNLAIAYKQFARKKADEVTRTISDGQAAGLGIAEIIDNTSSLVNGLQATQANTISNSSVNFVAVLARLAITKDEFLWISALDPTTCKYCSSRHNKLISKLGEEPPAHWNCKCHIEPVI